MRLQLLLLMLTLSLVACKSGRQMTAVEPSRPQTYQSPPREPAPPVTKPEEIPVIEESFNFQRKEDEKSHEVNRYFVILGSFRVDENAARFKSQLEGEGFTPVILLSETGFHRVSINSYSSEADARQRVMQIRRSYPEYHDSWLLIRR